MLGAEAHGLEFTGQSPHIRHAGLRSGFTSVDKNPVYALFLARFHDAMEKGTARLQVQMARYICSQKFFNRNYSHIDRHLPLLSLSCLLPHPPIVRTETGSKPDR